MERFYSYTVFISICVEPRMGYNGIIYITYAWIGSCMLCANSNSKYEVDLLPLLLKLLPIYTVRTRATSLQLSLYMYVEDDILNFCFGSHIYIKHKLDHGGL